MTDNKTILFDLSRKNMLKEGATPKKKRVSGGEDVEFEDIDIFNFGGMVDISAIEDDTDDIDEPSDYSWGDEEDSQEDKPKKKKKGKKKKYKTDQSISIEKVMEEKRKVAKKRAEDKEKARRRAEKLREEREEAKRQAEVDLIQLVARRDYLASVLNRLDGGRRKDSVKLVEINIELKNIDMTIRALCEKYGICEPVLNQGSRFSKFCNTAKRTIKSGFKRFKKFIKGNKESIFGIATIVVPVIGSFIASLILKR